MLAGKKKIQSSDRQPLESPSPFPPFAGGDLPGCPLKGGMGISGIKWDKR
jgi:hypothetical protein